MIKRFISLLLIVILFSFLAGSTYAKEENVESTNSSVPKTLDAYALFWPLSPGRTADDSLYFLKNIKEKINGMLIFGQSQKAEYEATLATKRILEAEKLYSENKKDIGDKTLSIGQENLDNIGDIFTNKPDFSENSGEIFKKLDNLEKFLSFSVVRKSQNEFKPVLTKVQSLISELRSQTSGSN